MRQIGRIPSEGEAQRFADHLLGLGVSTRLVPQDGATAVWVLDENKISTAVEELNRYTAEPTHPRYLEAGETADAVRKKAEQDERDYRKRVVSIADRESAPYWKRFPVAFGMMAIAVGVGIVTSVGNDKGRVLQTLLFTRIGMDVATGEPVSLGLLPIQQGEVWRLITPIFLHFGILHLIFNLMWIRSLGALVEWRKGSKKFLAMVFVLALASNYGQFFEMTREHALPLFGGLSGVVYGLFGYAWIRGKVRPEEGLSVDNQNVILMIVWFFLCLSGQLGPIANTAHGVGLILGILLALSPF